MTWTLEEARVLIIELERLLPTVGCHIGLTGGVLYKEGIRKDLDLIVYRIRDYGKIINADMVSVFEKCGVEIIRQYGWMYKARYKGKGIDILIPESTGKNDKYPSTQEEWMHHLVEFEST